MKTTRDDLTGRTFGRLLVQSYAGSYRYNCLCECGNSKTVLGRNLKFGDTVSCGCKQRENRRMLHPDRKTHGLSKTPIYGIWRKMILRCHDRTNDSFASYGGRGIVVCDEWRDPVRGPALFTEHMGLRPPAATVERINNDGNYEPGNCCWASRIAQARNRRSNNPRTAFGKSQLLVEWAEEYSIPHKVLRQRVNSLGWTLEKALTVPFKARRSPRRT